MRFLLLDRIDQVEPGTRIVGSKVAAMSEDYFEWHFPEKPIVPGVLILEACVQLAGWYEAIESDCEHFFLLDRVETARYYAFAGPGDRIELDLEPAAAEGDRLTFRGETRVDGKRSAVVAFGGRRVPLAELMDPAAARRDLETLRRDA